MPFGTRAVRFFKERSQERRADISSQELYKPFFKRPAPLLKRVSKFSDSLVSEHQGSMDSMFVKFTPEGSGWKYGNSFFDQDWAKKVESEFRQGGMETKLSEENGRWHLFYRNNKSASQGAKDLIEDIGRKFKASISNEAEATKQYPGLMESMDRLVQMPEIEYRDASQINNIRTSLSRLFSDGSVTSGRVSSLMEQFQIVAGKYTGQDFLQRPRYQSTSRYDTGRFSRYQYGESPAKFEPGRRDYGAGETEFEEADDLYLYEGMAKEKWNKMSPMQRSSVLQTMFKPEEFPLKEGQKLGSRGEVVQEGQIVAKDIRDLAVRDWDDEMADYVPEIALPYIVKLKFQRRLRSKEREELDRAEGKKKEPGITIPITKGPAVLITATDQDINKMNKALKMLELADYLHTRKVPDKQGAAFYYIGYLEMTSSMSVEVMNEVIAYFITRGLLKPGALQSMQKRLDKAYEKERAAKFGNLPIVYADETVPRAVARETMELRWGIAEAGPNDLSVRTAREEILKPLDLPLDGAVYGDWGIDHQKNYLEQVTAMRQRWNAEPPARTATEAKRVQVKHQSEQEDLEKHYKEGIISHLIPMGWEKLPAEMKKVILEGEKLRKAMKRLHMEETKGPVEMTPEFLEDKARKQWNEPMQFRFYRDKRSAKTGKPVEWALEKAEKLSQEYRARLLEVYAKDLVGDVRNPDGTLKQPSFAMGEWKALPEDVKDKLRGPLADQIDQPKEYRRDTFEPWDNPIEWARLPEKTETLMVSGRSKTYKGKAELIMERRIRVLQANAEHLTGPIVGRGGELTEAGKRLVAMKYFDLPSEIRDAIDPGLSTPEPDKFILEGYRRVQNDWEMDEVLFSQMWNLPEERNGEKVKGAMTLNEKAELLTKFGQKPTHNTQEWAELPIKVRRAIMPTPRRESMLEYCGYAPRGPIYNAAGDEITGGQDLVTLDWEQLPDSVRDLMIQRLGKKPRMKKMKLRGMWQTRPRDRKGRSRFESDYDVAGMTYSEVAGRVGTQSLQQAQVTWEAAFGYPASDFFTLRWHEDDIDPTDCGATPYALAEIYRNYRQDLQTAVQRKVIPFDIMDEAVAGGYDRPASFIVDKLSKDIQRIDAILASRDEKPVLVYEESLLDGNHRVAAAIIKGNTSMTALIGELGGEPTLPSEMVSVERIPAPEFSGSDDSEFDFHVFRDAREKSSWESQNSDWSECMSKTSPRGISYSVYKLRPGRSAAGAGPYMTEAVWNALKEYGVEVDKYGKDNTPTGGKIVFADLERPADLRAMDYQPTGTRWLVNASTGIVASVYPNMGVGSDEWAKTVASYFKRYWPKSRTFKQAMQEGKREWLETIVAEEGLVRAEMPSEAPREAERLAAERPAGRKKGSRYELTEEDGGESPSSEDDSFRSWDQSTSSKGPRSY